MKKKVIFGFGIIVVVFILTVIVGVIKGNEFNHLDPDEIVPCYENLVENLTREGYSIQEEEQALNCDVKAKRVIATKGDKYIDICYVVEDADINEVFKKYREKYENTSFYVLAQNGDYVYCISDKETFKKSGFSSTANVGYQIIYE